MFIKEFDYCMDEYVLKSISTTSGQPRLASGLKKPELNMEWMIRVCENQS